VERPALSLALTVQPDVIAGLASEATLRQRGFLARFLYSAPTSLVGGRVVAPDTVPNNIAVEYHQAMLRLWQAVPDDDKGGKRQEYLIKFSPEADEVLRELERWLEPRLAPGQELSTLAGWANKLAGACARIAGGMHLAVTAALGEKWQVSVDRETVEQAVAL